MDIGTGTGTIALMMAQRNATASIKAIELDLPSFMDADENISQSVFSARMSAIQRSKTISDTPYRGDGNIP